MTDVLWFKHVGTRLAQQYPRIPAEDIDKLLTVWVRLLEPVLPAGELERTVEQQVREALRSLSHALPRQRSAPDVVALR